MTNEEFIGMTIPQLIEEGITVKLLKQSRSRGCAGWFDSGKKELVVCTKHPDFFMVYIHEFCHFIQWRDHKEMWDKLTEGTSKFFNWLHNDGVHGGRKQAQELELDCEQRAVKLIKAHELEVDLDKYIQKANAYLYSYLITEKKQKWPVATNKVYADNVAALFPNKLQKLAEYNKVSNIPYEAKILMDRAYKL